ncbi:hypothetical protein CIRG_03669 [Coccidioides immitis RMSCC 2394]|uniref:Uncharacterized protein n=1 Tax=Coccidioides immitis RMSCC 2394 TaxID=404692 RepID=A0A0J7B2D5_COCIT|nr:hypothetical protein CIRG_03669 [Coccidioides immitis RMSCC 2394]
MTPFHCGPIMEVVANPSTQVRYAAVFEHEEQTRCFCIRPLSSSVASAGTSNCRVRLGGQQREATHHRMHGYCSLHNSPFSGRKVGKNVTWNHSKIDPACAASASASMTGSRLRSPFVIPFCSGRSIEYHGPSYLFQVAMPTLRRSRRLSSYDAELRLPSLHCVCTLRGEENPCVVVIPDQGSMDRDHVCPAGPCCGWKSSPDSINRWLKESFQLAAAGSTSVFRPLNAAKDLAFWLLP